MKSAGGRKGLVIVAGLLEVSVDLTNEKVQFTGTARSKPAVTIDSVPPLGDGQGYLPLELLLLGLASCSGITVTSLLRKKRKSVAGLQVKARGERRETHPTAFRKIYLEFTLHTADVSDAEMQKAIKSCEETYCPVWAMLKNNVEIIAEHKIIAAPDA